jgi:hypothetical protein
MLVETIKRAAGEVSFGPNETIDLPSDLVKRLVQAGAVRPLDVPVEVPAGPIDSPKKSKAKGKTDGPEADN